MGRYFEKRDGRITVDYFVGTVEFGYFQGKGYCEIREEVDFPFSWNRLCCWI